MKFEETLKQLEGIVERLEAGELALEESLEQFEEGIKLARTLAKKLAEAEKKVQILLKNEEGEITPQPFEPEK
ncbi:MAG: exodeoxyribonuclease VII small subunit [Thermodesulfobacteriota bacterium]